MAWGGKVATIGILSVAVVTVAMVTVAGALSCIREACVCLLWVYDSGAQDV